MRDVIKHDALINDDLIKYDAYNNKAYALFFKSETTLRSQLVRPKDAVDPANKMA